MSPAANAGPGNAMPRTIVGVDGCRGGWIAVSSEEWTGKHWGVITLTLHDSTAGLLDRFGEPAIIAIDMPIGLPDRIEGSGRGPEQAIRPLLGQRQSSVFSIPSRTAVEAPTYGEACRLALATSTPPRKVSKQAYNLFPRIRDLDRTLRSARRESVYEVHPEFALRQLNGGRAMSSPKKIRSRTNPDGMAERLACLAANGLAVGHLANELPRGAAMDDLVDAAACLAIARRIALGEARPWPQPFKRDAHDLPLAIWA